MYQNYVVEIIQNFAGEFEHNVYWLYDENPDIARLKAEEKFHQILAVAARSETASHAAIMFSQEGFPLRNECYKHEQAEG